MAIDKRLQIYDEQGNLVDYDILASDVKFLPDGKDLPTKLAEMEEEIDDAGGGYTPPVGGIPKSDLASDVQNTLDDVAGKVDKVTGKGLSTNDYTTAEKTKLGSLPTNPVQTISVNGGTPQTPVNGNVNISVEGGSVESVTVSGTKYTPDTNGDVNLGNLRGQDGNSGVASADGVESVNNLNGGTTDTQSKVYVLGANQGKRLRDQIETIYQRVQTLYGLLGNIAFWDSKPAASALLPDLDWGAPKHAVAITNSLSNSAITRNGLDAGSSIQAEEGSTVTLIVAPASGYALTSVSYVKDGGSSTSATSLGDGTYKIEFVMGGSDVAIAVSGTVVVTIPITYGTPTHCAAPSGVTNPSVVAQGGTANVQYECDNGYQLSAADITINGATIGIITHSGNVYTIPITHDGTSQSISLTATATVPPMKLLRGYYIGSDIKINSLPAAVTNAAIGNGTTVDVSKVVLTDYIYIDGDENSALQDYSVVWGVARGSQQDSQQGAPSVGSFFRKQDGVYKLITSWSWSGSTSVSRKVTASNFTSSSYGAALLEALQAGELYVRAALCLDTIEPAALVSTVAIKWGNTGNVTTLFSASSQFVISTDPTEFDPFTYDGAPQ